MLDDSATERLSSVLRRRKGLEHLRVKKHGVSLILLSGEGRDEVKHAKLTSLGKENWGLSLPRHTGRWERTPYVGTLDYLLKVLLTDLGFYLAPIS